MRARRAPDAALAGLLLDRELLGYQHSRAQFASWLEPPRPQLTLMIDLDGRAGRRRRGRCPTPGSAVWMTAPRSSASATPTGRSTSSSRRWAPTRSPALPLCRADRRVRAAATTCSAPPDASWWRGCARRQTGTCASTWWRRSCWRGWPPDPSRIRRWPGPGSVCAPATARVRVEALAAELGCSRRYLRDGFVRQVGLPPKTVARLMRFHHVRERIERRAGALGRRGPRRRLCRPVASQPRVPRAGRARRRRTSCSRLIPDGGVVGDRSH